MLGAMALGMMACSNNDELSEVQKGSGTMSLKIDLAGPTRAVGTSTLTADESKIKTLDVFVFKGEDVDGYKHATASDGASLTEVKGITVTTGNRTLVVVANSTNDLKGVTTKTALMAHIANDLETQKTANGLLMTSKETDEFPIKPGKNFYGYKDGINGSDATYHSKDKPVSLVRVPARVALIGASVNFQDPHSGWKFMPEEVFLFNAKKQSKFFGASLVYGEELLSGLNFTDFPNFQGELKPNPWETGWAVNYLKDTAKDLSKITANTPVYYYTFENDATKQKTVICVKGKLQDAEGNEVTKDKYPSYVDDNGFTYYSVVVNLARGGYQYGGTSVPHDGTIKRNTKYDITLNIKRPGTNDPTVLPDESATLDVLVTVAPWEVVTQEVDY